MARETMQGGKPGHWLVTKGEAQWLAWRDWLKREFGYGFFPEKLPVPQEWPPETHSAAAKVSGYYSVLNAEIEAEEQTKAHKEKSKSRGSFKPLPVAPDPWLRWSPHECVVRVHEFDVAERAAPHDKRDMGYIENLLKRSGQLPWYRENYRAQEATFKPRELSEAEIAELAAREKSLAQERLKLLLSKLPDQRGE